MMLAEGIIMSDDIKTYNKLVRDRIPDIIEEDGKKCVVRYLKDDEYQQALDAKLDEELAEYHKDQSVEELADLIEVIYAAAEARGCTVDELEIIRMKKLKKRGGFQKKVFLETVYKESR